METENRFRIYILSSLLVVVTLAALATYRLYRIADYQVFYNSSKSVCCPNYTVIHRSLLFEAVQEIKIKRSRDPERKEDLQDLTEMLKSLKAKEDTAGKCDPCRTVTELMSQSCKKAEAETASDTGEPE